MITLKSFLAKHNSGKIPEVTKTSTGRLMVFVENSLEIPRLFVAKNLEIKKPEDLDGKFVIKTKPKDSEDDILIICDSKLKPVF